MRLLWIAAIAGLAVFMAAAAGGPGDPRSDAYELVYVGLYVVPAALCVLRALLVSEQRLTWAACGIGMLCWAAGYVHYFVVLQDLQSPPYPSWSDALWLSYYVFSFIGLLALMKSGLSQFRRSLWIDAVVGGLAVAAVGAALLIKPILASTGGDVDAVATSIAYPLFDVLIVALLLGVFAISDRRPGPVWMLLGGAWIAQAVTDVVYLHQVATGTYAPGTLLDATWPALMLLIAFAAWRKPAVTKGVWVQGWGTLVVTIAFAAAGLFVTTYDHWHPVNDVAFLLATLTLLAAFVRTAMTFGEMRTLAHGKELLRQRELILEAAGEGIFGIDAEGTVTFANPAAARMTGYASEELSGRHLHGLLHHTRADGSPYPAEECPMLASLADGSVHRCDDDVYWRKDGTSFAVEFTSTPIVDGDGAGGAVVVFRDITDRREVERVKAQFTSVVSHELRTPLTSIRGSLGLLESGALGALPEKGQRMVQIAVQNTDRLVRLINDILDLERIDSGAVELRNGSCDAAQLIVAATDAVRGVADAAGVTLAVDTRAAALTGDADRLVQTLTNLISNAVKFSPVGSIVRIASERRGGEIVFSVADRGRGIPTDKLEEIFERFQQVDASDAREKGGTGLGLAICRSIVEQHRGRIWAESEIGVGSTFSFALPLAPWQSAGAHDLDGDGAHRPRVLVCDDDADVREVVGAMLSQHGYRVVGAGCGEEAIQAALDDPPDAILLDMLMPGMSGWATMGALRKHPETVDIPIVILSVLPRADDELPDVATVEWVEKPADDATLLSALQHALGSGEDVVRVLVVEDDPDLAELLSVIFERRGIESLTAASGREAIELCQRVSPDLLVLDVGLPDIDGFEVVDWLRRHERLSRLPLVVHTARDLDDADRARLTLGSVTEFLIKSQVTSEQFEQRVMTLLARITHNQASEVGHAPAAHPARR